MKTQAVFEFFDPHPGLAGCTARIPNDVRQAAIAMNWKVMTVEEACAQVRHAAGPGFIVDFVQSCILLKWKPEGSEYPIYCWRVIRARPAGGGGR